MWDRLRGLFDGGRREQMQARVRDLLAEHAAVADRLIDLSGRTDLARQSAGKTLVAFKHVENAFLMASKDYSKVSETVERIKEEATRNQFGSLERDEFRVRAELGRVKGALNELEHQLNAWEGQWNEAPRLLRDGGEALTRLKESLRYAEGQLGMAVPIQVQAFELHLDETRVIAAGNPVEATHRAKDLLIALEKANRDLQLYTSAAGAIKQALDEIADASVRVDGAGESAADLRDELDRARSLAAQLKPLLAAGKLDHFQHSLGEIQQQLAQIRRRLPA